MLVRTDPFREMDRVMAQFFNSPVSGGTRTLSMPVDAWREGDAFFISLDLPGVDAGSIDLEVERHVLSVNATRPELRVSDQAETVVAERHHGPYSRQFVLGDNLDSENIRASYENGVLTLRIPVAERAKSRKINVSTAPHATTIEGEAGESHELAGSNG